MGSSKYTANYRYFKDIDSEDKAYWLGFLYADGCVRKVSKNSFNISLQLSEKDKRHIELFKECINANHPIRKDLNMSRIILFSEDMASDLKKWGCVPRKTFKIKGIPNINKSLINHFIRGYHDGDGWNYIDPQGYFRLCGLGTESFCVSIIDHLGYGVVHRDKGSNIFRYNFNGTKGKRFAKFLYSNASIYLDRKYNKINSEVE